MAPYTVGITIWVNADGSLGLFENGLRQNVIFLFRLFKAAPNCKRVFLLNHGDGEPTDIPDWLGVDKADIVRTSEVLDQLDHVITMGAAMDAETARALKQRGCRFIAYKGGNGAVLSMEGLAGKRLPSCGDLYFDHDWYDAVWVTPQHMRTYRSWCETIYRCPVVEVPQIWSPLFLKASGAKIGYQPGQAQWRIGIMDPNITVMKTSHLPMLVCEEAFRRRPEAFAAFYVTNALEIRDYPAFASFAGCLDAVKAGKMTVEPRFVTSEFLANHCDAVVTHHWENGLNYLYYDVLYGGYPLVHNSAWLRDHGYFYDDFDARSGAEALLRARDDHDGDQVAYRARNARLFARLDPASEPMIRLHEGLLEQAALPPGVYREGTKSQPHGRYYYADAAPLTFF